MPCIAVNEDGVSTVQGTCASAGSSLSGSTTDVTDPGGSSEALNAFAEQAKKLNDLVKRYGAVISNDASTLERALEQFGNWDSDTSAKYQND